MEFSTTKTDEWGISGNYFCKEGLKITEGKYARKIGFEFTRENNGVVVNELKIPTSLGDVMMKLDEKVKNKHKITLFYSGERSEYREMMQVEKDVFLFVYPTDNYYAVLVKDEALYDTWDPETAMAVYEQKYKEINKAKDAALIEKLNTYETYQQYKGKIAFTKLSGGFNDYTDDTPSENPKDFTKEWVTGENLYMRSYFTQSFNSYCASCSEKVNYVLEMGKHKVDWMELRSSSSAYSTMIVPSTLGNQFMTGRTWMWDNFDFNRALIHVIHLNIKDGALKEGAVLPLKISIYPHADKTNKEKMAEGTLNVKLNSSNSSWKARYESYKNAVE